MLQTFLAIVGKFVAGCAIVLVFALTLSRPSMPQNKLYRFVLLFVLCVPLNVIINYVNVWTLGYHKTGWTWTFISALLLATWLTFLPAEPHDSSTP
jgi:hypothetical protein